jgi:PAS domain S-box-containing protein
MKFRQWPRTIRSQLLCGLVLLEVLSLVIFGTLLVRQQREGIYLRAQLRLKHQSTSLAQLAQDGLESGHPETTIPISTRMMASAPSVATAKVTDPSGKVLFAKMGDIDQEPLEAGEIAQIAKISDDSPYFFILHSPNDWECVKPIHYEGELYGYAWVKSDRDWDREQLTSTFSTIILFGAVWIAASVVLAWAMARSITRPLAVLHRGTQALMRSPEGHAHFPLPTSGSNEIGDLIQAFNRMVASIEEQRSGLSDTLSLLDSMLANAPIGLAFFDRRYRFVRVNRVFAETSGIPLSRHLGRTPAEIFPAPVAHKLENTIRDVFEHGEPLRDLEVTGVAEDTGRPWAWITSAYPIHTAPEEVRWVGFIVLDASDRKRGEEALRKTEKLAATGRLAASIAHEINNPLEAITNLLFLLSNYADLQEPARTYVDMAEHEVRRISEITQQTLRFYRQSTLPARANLSELLDSVLRLHQSRLRNLGIVVEKEYDDTIDLHCFAGELRQVFSNLIGNAIDAMPVGGKLGVRARRSRNWHDTSRTGLRFQVSDTGSGMLPSVQKHIFEPFFTTKEVTGTGLGLWVSSEIVAKHRGSIRVRSRSETLGGQSGTVFELFFPDEVELVSPMETAELHAV